MGAHSLGQRHFKTAFKNKKVNGKPITFNSTRMQYELKKKKKKGVNFILAHLDSSIFHLYSYSFDFPNATLLSITPAY
jgi:hypothetical protein